MLRNFMKMVNFVRGIFCFVIVTCFALKGAEKMKSITNWGPPEWLSKYRFYGTPQSIDIFCTACLEGDKELVESFFPKGVDINGLNTVDIKLKTNNFLGFDSWYSDVLICSKKRRTPLMCAIQGDKADITDLLLNNPNINIDQKNIDDQTALHGAVICGSLKYVTLLLDKHAHINRQDNIGFTPLHCGILDAGYVDVSITKYLVKSGADMRIKDNAERTPLYTAAFSNNLACNRVRYLLGKGAPINEMSKSGIANLYALKNNDRPICQEWASILFKQGSMSKEKEIKRELSLGILCFNVLEKNGLIPGIFGRKVNEDVRRFCIERLVERKTVSEVIKLLQQACHSKKIGPKTVQEIAECENIKKNFVPGYVDAETECKIDERCICYHGPDWQKKSVQEQASEKLYLLIRLKSHLGERMIAAIDNKKVELVAPAYPT
jgi:hypothetical protein